MGCVRNSEIVEMQRKATLLINPRPSDEEFCKYSFPSKTIEYMASGTPVLMTRLPGVPAEYFEYVYIINDETVEGVCDALRRVLAQPEDELTRFGLAAREFVAENKGCATQCERIIDFLKQVEK